jgi:hypothetical protein
MLEKNDSQSCAHNIGIDMVWSLEKQLEKNLRVGGKDMKTSMETPQHRSDE